jgi:hypothetical protein
VVCMCFEAYFDRSVCEFVCVCVCVCVWHALIRILISLQVRDAGKTVFVVMCVCGFMCVLRFELKTCVCVSEYVCKYVCVIFTILFPLFLTGACGWQSCDCIQAQRRRLQGVRPGRHLVAALNTHATIIILNSSKTHTKHHSYVHYMRCM